MSTNRRCLPSGRVCGCASSSSPVYMVCFWEVHDEADTASTPLGPQVLPFLRKKIGLPIAILFLPCMPFFKLRTNLVFILLQDDQDFERFCKENAALLDSICGGDEVPIKTVG